MILKYGSLHCEILETKMYDSIHMVMLIFVIELWLTIDMNFGYYLTAII